MDSLPSDLVFEVLCYLKSVDLFHFVSTSRKHYGYLRDPIHGVELWRLVLNREFRIDHGDGRSLGELEGEVRIKADILSRIYKTMQEIMHILNQRKPPLPTLSWAFSGGMSVRYHGVKRMTRDLDIHLYSPQTDGVRGLWWATELDVIFAERHWNHVRDPFQNEDLYLNYANSWAHPEYKIKVDIVSSIHPIKPIYSPSGLPYLSLSDLIQLKIKSSLKRVEHSAKQGKRRDICDIKHLIKLHQLEESFCKDWSRDWAKTFLDCLWVRGEEIVEHVPKERSKDETAYLVAQSLGDEELLMDLVLHHKRPWLDKHTKKSDRKRRREEE